MKNSNKNILLLKYLENMLVELFGYTVQELIFNPSRKWRFDFACCDEKQVEYRPKTKFPHYIPLNTSPVCSESTQRAFKLAIEVEGGHYGKSRHTSIKGFEGDIVKYNSAVIDGWLLIRCTYAQISSGYMLELLETIKRNYI